MKMIMTIFYYNLKKIIYYIILFKLGIDLNKLLKNPLPAISFFDINLFFLYLHTLHVDFNIYRIFFVMKALTFKFFVFFLHFKQYIIYNYISFFKQGLEPYSSFFPAVFGITKSRCST